MMPVTGLPHRRWRGESPSHVGSLPAPHRAQRAARQERGTDCARGYVRGVPSYIIALMSAIWNLHCVRHWLSPVLILTPFCAFYFPPFSHFRACVSAPREWLCTCARWVRRRPQTPPPSPSALLSWLLYYPLAAKSGSSSVPPLPYMSAFARFCSDALKIWRSNMKNVNPPPSFELNTRLNLLLIAKDSFFPVMGKMMLYETSAV